MYKRSITFLTVALIMAMVVSACLAQPEPMIVDSASDDTGSSSESMDNMVALSRDEAAPGGVWTEASIADASILNPILYSDSASFDIISQIFPTLLGIDPETGAFAPTEMAASWESSEDGLTWTFYLRDDVTWSDGEPVDADDFKFTYDAVSHESVETPRKSNVESIENINIIDEHTIEVTFSEVRCTALNDVNLGWLPSHLYADDFSDIMDSPLNEDPTTTGDRFGFQSWARDDNVVMVRNEGFFKGAPLMDGYIYKIVPDQDAQLAQLQTQEISVMTVPPRLVEAAERIPHATRFRNLGNGYSYIGLNLANPENPQPGRDEDGNLVDQDPHPILSDRNVRLAIAHSLNYDAIIDEVFLGEGYQIASNVMPALEWAHNGDLEPYAYDPELAASILAEAGWADSDGDGVLDKDGQTLS
ncbi:hypothetical protein KFU94_60785 [Chloroflexi bacterium TSY]|nr:hypothetical protein [Chloroflexi bacterium TSY]